MLLFRFIRAIAALPVLIALSSAAQPAHAAARHAALVIDANTGTALHEDAADELRHPASLAKIMTLYLAFEAIERGRTSYATRIRVSVAAAAAPPTKLGLEAGSEIALIDAIKALITKSANDMAVAIAEHLAGSEEQFAALMTEQARRLGMTATQFRNASGLHDPEQVTTARDMLRLALRLQDDFPTHYRLFALRSFAYGGRTIRTHNMLLANFAGTDGIKTGYVRMSGYNLVSSVRRGNRHVVGVVFGGRTAKSRDATMRTLLTQALRRSSTIKTRRTQPVLIGEPRPARRAAAAPTPRVEAAPPRPLPIAAMPQLPAPAVAVRPAVLTSASGFEVQIGAYASTADAERALSAARSAAGGLLLAYPARTVPIAKDNRVYYRARFGGFDGPLAASTCAELRRNGIDCFVSKAE
jgi:D-alanyl-D-alanine carboxypeptidase